MKKYTMKHTMMIDFWVADQSLPDFSWQRHWVVKGLSVPQVSELGLKLHKALDKGAIESWGIIPE